MSDSTKLIGAVLASSTISALSTYLLLKYLNKPSESSNPNIQTETNNAPSSSSSSQPHRIHFDKDFAESEIRKIRYEESEKQKSLLESGQSNEIYEEQNNRTKLFYGEEAFNNIKNAFVIVVGLGGVGSAAAHTLLRSGVGRLRLIDPDVVTLSSLNRNALAQRKDVGRTKAQVLKDYFAKISPETRVEALQMFFTYDLAPTLLEGNPTYVLDCIDNKETKVALMYYCKQHGIPIISSFGAGSSCDPTKISVTDIADTFGCPLGRDIRRELRIKGVTEGILCVSSAEKNRKKMIPLTETEVEEIRAQKSQGVVRLLRVGTLGVSMPIPSIFGTAMANAILNSLAGLPVIFRGEVIVPPSMHEAARCAKLLAKTEHFLNNTPQSKTLAEISPDLLRYVLEQVWHSESSINVDSRGILTVARWRPERPLTVDNMVVLTEKEHNFHKKVKVVEESYPEDVVKRIDSVLAKERQP
eukprot:TRINITY_DN2210_c0_g1_i1.p1 TRINITY_DN2210_c0_g1~~TRINITY_DN2210_c0_g1_i1.p1  ORF type:complete len:498 (-),score=117.90 TRINITY_DN2210_c0_g1_i1:46-1458(-)